MFWLWIFMLAFFSCRMGMRLCTISDGGEWGWLNRYSRMEWECWKQFRKDSRGGYRGRISRQQSVISRAYTRPRYMLHLGDSRQEPSKQRSLMVRGNQWGSRGAKARSARVTGAGRAWVLAGDGGLLSIVKASNPPQRILIRGKLIESRLSTMLDIRSISTLFHAVSFSKLKLPTTNTKCFTVFSSMNWAMNLWQANSIGSSGSTLNTTPAPKSPPCSALTSTTTYYLLYLIVRISLLMSSSTLSYSVHYSRLYSICRRMSQKQQVSLCSHNPPSVCASRVSSPGITVKVLSFCRWSRSWAMSANCSRRQKMCLSRKNRVIELGVFRRSNSARSITYLRAEYYLKIRLVTTYRTLVFLDSMMAYLRSYTIASTMKKSRNLSRQAAMNIHRGQMSERESLLAKRVISQLMQKSWGSIWCQDRQRARAGSWYFSTSDSIFTNNSIELKFSCTEGTCTSLSQKLRQYFLKKT